MLLDGRDFLSVWTLQTIQLIHLMFLYLNHRQTQESTLFSSGVFSIQSLACTTDAVIRVP